MHHSPRTRRLRNDLIALERLRADSSIFRFTAAGDPPQQYQIWFQGKSLWRDHSKVKVLESHRVEIKLGASYPRTVPELRWLTPIFHPNISEIGMVCLGGYGTHWVPSVQLDELCVMLWDMARYSNFDIRSPYNREASIWASDQSTFRFPTDDRQLRDLRAAQGRTAVNGEKVPNGEPPSREKKTTARPSPQRARSNGSTPVTRVLNFIEHYSRVFGNAIGSEASGGNGTDHARSRPEFDHMRQILDRSAASGPPRAVAPSPPPVVRDHEPANASPTADSEIIELVDANNTERGQEPDELIILDESDEHPIPNRVAPVGGEILYIE